MIWKFLQKWHFWEKKFMKKKCYQEKYIEKVME